MEAYERLWRDFPRLGMKYDAANWMGKGMDPLPAPRKHGDKILHVHIKDHLYHEGELASQPAAGMGDVPFPKILAFLYEHRYAGALSIEPHGPWQKRPDLRAKMLRLSKRYLEPMLLP
ncbi:MAG: TIM barrel protein [Planctomycetota bacterium]|nr:TIM barrel protein [Planctomycetota bacterium]